MATATDKKRWDDLHAALAKAEAAELAYEIELGAKYGHNFSSSWLSKGQKTKLESLRAKKNKIGEKIYELVERISPRDWSSGVPSWWVRSKLTWEDAIRPKNEPLSVVVPGAYGSRDGTVTERESSMATRKMRSRRQPSLPGFPDIPEKLEIKIPVMSGWEQIGGDMDPGAYGGLIATADGDHIELLEIQPVREYVGDKEAADVGHPFWTKEAWFDLADLDPSNKDVQSALESSGFDSGDQKTQFEDEATPEQRALVIAEALLMYGRGDEGPSGWSKDLPDYEVKWSSGKTATLRDYLADEDESFRREVLGEEEEEEDIPEVTAKDILDGLGAHIKKEGHDATKESKRIEKLIEHANNPNKVDKVLETVDKLTNANGIEAIRGDHHVDNYYQDIVALYVNMGDTYDTTLLYDTSEDKFLVTSFGDWVEANKRKYKIQ